MGFSDAIDFAGFIAGLNINECYAYVEGNRLLCRMDCRVLLLEP
jgi:hypothetical protein